MGGRLAHFARDESHYGDQKGWKKYQIRLTTPLIQQPEIVNFLYHFYSEKSLHSHLIDDDIHKQNIPI